MALSKFVRILFFGILLILPAILCEEQFQNVFGAEISNYVTLKQLKDPTWGDATPNPEVNESDYYEFSANNFEDSQVAVWYSLWTVLRQNDTQWEEFGEWRLFGYDWHNTKNFECALSMTQCSGDLGLEGLQALYPGIEYRPLVRRIYFASRAYRIFHNYANVIQSSFERLKTDLIPMTPELVSSFTQQKNVRAERICSMIQSVSESLIALAVAFASSAASMGLGPVPQEAATMQATTLGIQAVGNAILSVTHADLATELRGTARKLDKIKGPGLPGFLRKVSVAVGPIMWTSRGMMFKYEWWGNIQNLPFIYYASTIKAVKAVRREYGSLDVEGGAGDGGWGNLCASFEGDFGNRNALNIEKLQTWIPGQFKFIRNQVHKFYKDVYEGHVPYRGAPSMMAFMLAGNRWAGDDSFLSDLRDPDQWGYEMERNFVKGVISKLLAKSYNYLRCTHDPKARSMCDAAEKYSKSSSEWDESISIISKSRFCPRPRSDPDLICQVEKWYFSVNEQHTRAMNGLDAFETFQADRFKFRRKELFQEAYDHYAQCGNNCTNLDWNKGPFSRDVSFTGAFHLPTCQNDHLSVPDFTRFWAWKAHTDKSWNGYENGEWTQWDFPSICGDHHASETKGFLEAMNAGEHSDVYAHHHPIRATDQLWKDRIPRALEILDLSPYSHFVAMCEASIYFPGRAFLGENDDKISRSPRQGTHFRCQDVQTATAQMNEYAANKWFCVDSDIGKDIQADSPRRGYHIMGTPHRRLRTYKQRCSTWREKWNFEGEGEKLGETEWNVEEQSEDQRPSNSTMKTPPKDENRRALINLENRALH